MQYAEEEEITEGHNIGVKWVESPELAAFESFQAPVSGVVSEATFRCRG